MLKKEDYIIGNEDDEEFASQMVRAAHNAMTADVARNQFRHCKIRVPECD
jgi:hypothetical protein